MITSRPRLISLLQAAASDQRDLSLTALGERLIRWAVETGLGPLLLRATQHDIEAEMAPLSPAIKGADLTARVLSAQQIDALTEIIDACQGHAPPLVLLKGISLCDAHYPEPHLRPMRDVDILVEDDAVAAVETIIAKLGYVRSSREPAGFFDTHHHGCPLVHPDTGVWVEVHRALASLTSGLTSDSALGRANLRTQLVPSRFRGRLVRRLSDELQIVHLACHWADDLRAVASNGTVGGMVVMFDLVFLLKHNPAVRWERIVEWTNGSLAGRYVFLLLAYLDRHRVVEIPSEILRRLRPRHSLDSITVKLAHSMIDRYVLDGRDFDIVLSDRNFARIWGGLVCRRPRVRSASRGRNGRPHPVNASADAEHAVDANGPSPPSEASHTGTWPMIFPKRRSDVRDRLLDGELVILDRRRHLVHQLNPTARYIWERCDGEHTVKAITVELAQAFDVDVDRAAHDVAAAVRQLEAVGLVEPALSSITSTAEELPSVQ